MTVVSLYLFSGARHFKTDKKTDIKEKELRASILSLKEKAEDQQSEVRLFYFCGHGGRDRRDGETWSRGRGQYILDKAGQKVYCNDILAWLKVRNYFEKNRN